MFCSNCGANLPDGTKFCNNCGSPVGLQDIDLQQHAAQVRQEPVYQAPVQQPIYQQPVQQPPVYQQPVQQAPYPPQYYQTMPTVVVQNAPVKETRKPDPPTNGPAIAGLVFGIITFVLLLFAAIVFRGATNVMGGNFNSYSDDQAIAFSGLFMIAVLAYIASYPMYLFHFIFSLIGFIKGLKNKVKVVAAIIGFILILVNIILIIAEIGGFVIVMGQMGI